MTRVTLLLTSLFINSSAMAHGGEDTRHDGVILQEGTDYETCYIDFHSELTQKQYREFNSEWGSAYAFTPQSGPTVLGTGNVQFSGVLRSVAIDDGKDSWNNTWTHPTADHWLGPVQLPILSARVGLTPALDIETMFSFGNANWAIGGVGLRHTLLTQDDDMPLDLSLREHVQVTRGGSAWANVSVGADVSVGRTFELGTRLITATPYLAAGASSGLGIESDDDVDLKNAISFSPRATAGLELAVGPARLGIEGSVADINQYAFHVGASF